MITMTQLPLIKQVVNFPTPGKEQFFSHIHNTSYELFQSGNRFIYVILDIGDYLCFVNSSDNLLELHEVEFLKSRFEQFNYIVTNAQTPSSKLLKKSVEAKLNTLVSYYDRVLV